MKNSIEAFAKKGEKNMLKNMFKQEGDSSDDSMSENENEIEEKSRRTNTNTDDKGQFSALHDYCLFENMDTISNINERIDKKRDKTMQTNNICNAAIVIEGDNEYETSMDSYKSTKNLFTVKLIQNKKKGIAHQLWPAAIHLSTFLENNISLLEQITSSNIENISVLELGAGIGLCGLVCSKLEFKKVIVTDLPVAIDILNSNILLNNNTDITDTDNNNTTDGINSISSSMSLELNKEITDSTDNNDNNIEDNKSDINVIDQTNKNNMENELNNDNNNDDSSNGNYNNNIEAQVLSWGNKVELKDVMNLYDKNSPIIVIAADCVYWEILFQPLYETIKELVLEHDVEIIISHVKRWKKDEKFFRMCRKTMDVVLLEDNRIFVPAVHTGVLTREIKRIYRIKKKS